MTTHGLATLDNIGCKAHRCKEDKVNISKDIHLKIVDAKSAVGFLGGIVINSMDWEQRVYRAAFREKSSWCSLIGRIFVMISSKCSTQS